jgi:hypothetical protein
MVLHGTTFFTVEGMFPLFTHMAAAYRLRHLVNNVVDLMVANIRFSGSANASPVNSIFDHQISN